MIYLLLAGLGVALALWVAGNGRLNRRGDLFRLASVAVVAGTILAGVYTWAGVIAVSVGLFLSFGGFWYFYWYTVSAAERNYRDLRDRYAYKDTRPGRNVRR